MRFSRVIAALFMLGVMVWLPPTLADCYCSSWGQCSYCAGTCNACGYSNVSESPKTVHTLPLDFTYQSIDKNTANNSCSSTDCGTLTCPTDGGTYTANKLPIPAASADWICDPTNHKQLPTQFNCRWKDYSCYQYCSRVQYYTCCQGYTCDNNNNPWWW